MKKLAIHISVLIFIVGCSAKSTSVLNAENKNNTRIISVDQIQALSSNEDNSPSRMNTKPLTDKAEILDLPQVKKVFFANSDFTLHNASSTHAIFYDDAKTDALAIDAANLAFRTKFAKASYRLTETFTGSFQLGLVSLSEFDGESRYKLYLNDELVGDFTNPSTSLDFHEVYFETAKPVTLTKGDILTVEAIAASNGLIPEDGGYAWSRGRWRAVTVLAINK